jgi:2-polyprenyl-3-methyl-5-hydroxy-6-metoxy-1,4-benzoquinol methylase
MFNSTKYWNQRYINGGNSGAGSYNELSQFKADIINNFIENNQIKSIVDYGVGDGNQLKLINTENLIYTGIDVSEFIISKCKEEFKDDKTKKFIHIDNIDNELKTDLVLSCDVIYHLIEEPVYKEYMDNLFSMSKKYVIIYAPNINYNEAVHVKKREFIEYIFDNYTNFNLVKRIKGKGCPFYIFQKNDTYTQIISKNILQVTKKNPVNSIHVNEIKKNFDDYSYYWFNDENMYKYIQYNQLEDFPNIINHMKSLTKGQHKADIFRYYWLYLNGGIFMDDDLMIEKKIDFKNNTFVSVKSYHTNKNILFNGFIACTKFNPIIYKALKNCYITNNNALIHNYHLFCSQFYNIYQLLKKHQNTFLLQEVKSSYFREGVKSYYNNEHLLTHWCYSKKIKI